MEPPDLPSECLAHIISYISDPVTLRSLLVANRTISDITHRNVESIMEGDVSFLCRFARLITVEKPILIYDKDDIERLARLPKLRSASFLLTPTYFQRASAQPAGRRAKIVEIQEQLNPFDNLSVLVSQILKNELMEIYCRDFSQAISIFLQTVGPIYVTNR